MDVHKPSPIRNWREFLKEVGTIMLGVSIALAAEQVVEWWHWRGQVTQAREVIATELAQNIGSAIVVWRGQICTERRLDEMAQILDKASETGRLPPVGDIGRPPRRAWRFGAWDTLVASQVATHFPRQELVDLASIYTFVHQIADNSSADFESWNRLYTMVGPGRRLDGALETELRRGLTDERALSRRMAAGSDLLIQLVRSMHLPFSKQDLALIDGLRQAARNSETLDHSVPNLRGGFGICQPIGAVPPSYGRAIPNTAPVLTDERLETMTQIGGP